MAKRPIKFFIVLCLGLHFINSILITKLQARPEYALRVNNNCMACHVSPLGGGHRKMFGKIYGANGLGSFETAQNEMFYGDFRALFQRKEGDNSEVTSSGLTVMQAEASANVPIIKAVDSGDYTQSIVLSHDLGSLLPGTRQAYVLFSDVSNQKLASGIMIGKFLPPFGLPTDEHRTYTHLQTQTAYNADFVTGANFSGDPFSFMHYDLALHSGFRKTGLTPNDDTYGFITNFRWKGPTWPFFVGTSWASDYTKVKQQGPSQYAYSLYSVLDLLNMTEQKVPLTVYAEWVTAHNYNTDRNTNISARFVDNTQTPAYRTALKGKTSEGAWVELKYRLFPRWEPSYKYEVLWLDRSSRADTHFKHTLGTRVIFNSNTDLNMSLERARATRPGVASNKTLWSNRDGFIAYLRVWL